MTYSERDEWHALLEADTLMMLPKEALIASIKVLAAKLLDLTEEYEEPGIDVLARMISQRSDKVLCAECKMYIVKIADNWYHSDEPASFYGHMAVPE